MKRNDVQKKNSIDTPYESNINTVFEEHSSPENKNFGIVINDEV